MFRFHVSACLFLFLQLMLVVHGQGDLNDAILEVFKTTTTAKTTNGEGDFFDTLDGDLVPEKELESTTAIEKCGEGEDKGVHLCVPYYQCDGKTRTIIATGSTSGVGLIDIRFGDKCDHYLDVCCKIPAGGVPPSVTTAKPDGGKPVTDAPPVTLPPPTPGKSFCGIRNEQGIDFTITNDKDHEAQYGEFPWMVAILRPNFDPAKETLAVCGGALIAPNVVVTGAHCIRKYNVKDLVVRAGEWDSKTDRERIPYQERTIKQIIVHKDYQEETLYNNVALLILDSIFAKADNVGTVCLPPQGTSFANERHCFATGWGKDKFGKEGLYQAILKKIELPIVPFDKCQDALRTTRLGAFFKLHRSFTCAGGEAGKDTCTGDGGSPLVCPDPANPERYYQAGIVSWGIGCGEKNIPGVYVDLTKFRNWIDAALEKLNIGQLTYTV